MTPNKRKTEPLVSVIMPNYNSGKLIDQAIESVLNQTYKNLELIIVDDCSTDISKTIISEYASKDLRIRQVFKDLNEGAAACRNIALDMARGEYISFLDSDDCWKTHKLQSQIPFMLDNNYSFVYSSYDVISPSSNYCYTLKAPQKISKMKMLLSNFIGCTTVVVSSTLLGATRQRNIICRNDYMFWIDILKNGGVAHNCPGVYSAYRKGTGLSSNRLRNFLFYLYVISNATSYGVILLPFTTPIFLTLNLIKKKFPSFYNRVVNKI